MNRLLYRISKSRKLFTTISPSLSSTLAIGIRREGKNRWERRVPLCPDQVERLVKELGVTVYIQPSTKRVIPNEKYVEAGAIVQEDLSSADIIMGVKEVPVKDLIPEKTYMFFSHTHKGQPYNMIMLRNILEKKIRLIDYELLTNEQGARLVQFSRFAGYAGMVDGLHSLGHRLLALGHGNPFLAVGMSYMYRAVADARLDVTRTGMVIADDGLPKELGPMIFVIVGNGNVSKGAMHLLKCLPHEWVKPEDLANLAKSKDFDNHKVYVCQIGAKDYCIDKEGQFNEDRYYTNPSEYNSIFHEKIAPYASFILNGIFWTSKFPRLLTTEQTRILFQKKKLRLFTLADVSCDINGSFEFMSEASTIDYPYYMYDPETGKNHDNLEGTGIQIMSIDNLPTEMPLEASEFFSESLYPVVTQLAKGNFKNSVLARAAITKADGTLEEHHQNLSIPLGKYASDEKIQVSTSKKILVLGSGFVAKPLVDYLLRFPNYSVTIASNIKEEALEIAGGRSRVVVSPLDVKTAPQLGLLVENHDLVVSFVPATMHPLVAEQCIKFKKNMVTASYISPAMKALHERAKQAGISIVNEIGLDPGIDHLTAMEMFDKVKSKGGVITSFVSWCGGLPAPEVSNNPLGYKFSWSPKGVLLAGLNSAKFKRNGKEVLIEGNDLLINAVDVPIFKGFSFEGLANRDSLSYIDTYQLDKKHLQTMFRGTLRYKGYSELMNGFAKLGLLDSTPRNDLVGLSWAGVLKKILGPNGDIKTKLASQGLILSPEAFSRFMSAISWLELDSSEVPLSSSAESVLDAFCSLLENRLVYEEGERDMVAMHHEFGVKWSDGKEEKHLSTMIAYGDPASYSAMAKTVGFPAAIASDMVLKGELKQLGVFAPLAKDTYAPMIQKLNAEGIKFVERVYK